MKLTGAWTGAIVYGKMYRNHAGKELVFEMNIVQQDNLFKGECFDISGTGINSDPATIEGTLHENRISFIKQYPTLYYYKNGQTRIDSSKKGKEIKYEGVCDEDAQVFKGTWRYKNAYRFLWIFKIPSSSGKWEMRKSQ